MRFKQFLEAEGSFNLRSIYPEEFPEHLQQGWLRQMEEMSRDPEKYIQIRDRIDWDSIPKKGTKLDIHIEWYIKDPHFFDLYDLLSDENKAKAFQFIHKLVKDTDKEFFATLKKNNFNLDSQEYEVYLGWLVNYMLDKTDIKPKFAQHIAKSAARKYNQENDDVFRINKIEDPEERRRAIDQHMKNQVRNLTNLAKVVSGKRK